MMWIQYYYLLAMLNSVTHYSLFSIMYKTGKILATWFLTFKIEVSVSTNVSIDSDFVNGTPNLYFIILLIMLIV